MRLDSSLRGSSLHGWVIFYSNRQQPTLPLEQLAWHSSQEWFDGGQEASGPGPPMGQVIGDRVLYRWDENEVKTEVITWMENRGWSHRALSTFKKVVYQM